MCLKRILYINTQIRFYDRLKYLTLSQYYDLTVIWINPFRKSECISNDLRNKFNYLILGFVGDRLKPWHVIYNIKLFIMILKHGKKSQLIISSTSDTWHSKIAYFANLFIRKKIAYRKEVWFRIKKKNLIKEKSRQFHDYLTKYIEKKADLILIPGIKQKEFVIERGINITKINYFPYLIEDIFINQRPTKSQETISFIYLGRVIPLKGLDVLIDVFIKINNVYSGINLIVIGGPSNIDYEGESTFSYFNTCKQKAEGNSNIFFKGYINPNEVGNFFDKLSILVHPVRKEINGEIVGEGWGNIIVESASMGVPILATDRVSSAFELVENDKNGFIINSDNLEEDLYNKMKFFIENPNKIIEFGLASREKYEIFNNPQKIINSINSVLNNE